MPDARSERAVQRLNGLREQRRQALLDAKLLADRTRQAVAGAQEAGVPVAQIARSLGIDRSTLYRVYLDDAAA